MKQHSEIETVRDRLEIIVVVVVLTVTQAATIVESMDTLLANAQPSLEV